MQPNQAGRKGSKTRTVSKTWLAIEISYHTDVAAGCKGAMGHGDELAVALLCFYGLRSAGIRRASRCWIWTGVSWTYELSPPPPEFGDSWPV